MVPGTERVPAKQAPAPESGPGLTVVGISTGSGQLFPYRIRLLDSFGNPTATIVDIQSRDTLFANLNANNGVLPLATWPGTTTLPNGQPGNHFLVVRFDRAIDANAFLPRGGSPRPAVVVETIDPTSGIVRTVRGVGVAGGQARLGGRLQPAIANVGGSLQILDPRFNGFPSGFTGDGALADPNVFVFVPDADGSLTSFETMPRNVEVRVTVTDRAAGALGEPLALEARIASTVGPDTNPARLLGDANRESVRSGIVPAPGTRDVPIDTTVELHFTKPVQPLDVGAPRRAAMPPAAGGVSIVTTTQGATLPIPYTAEPRSYANLCDYVLVPARAFPGRASVDVAIGSLIRSLTGRGGSSGGRSNFTTGAGPGIVNAPVAPEAIYIGVAGTAASGISVIDLNGFGQGTGSPATTNFLSNPNVGSPGITPSLSPGSSTLDAGGAGQLTLTTDSAGGTLLNDAFSDLTDIHIGWPLDLVFNNSAVNINASAPNQVNPANGITTPGNTIGVAPHPNPPRLVLPTPNPAALIFSEEPTVTSSTGPPGLVTTTAPPCLVSPINLLLPGPTGLLGTTYPGVFYGPQPTPALPPPPPVFCPYTSRQQVGHFLYAADRAAGEVVVLNSNQMTVLGRIPVQDPTSLAMAPGLSVLAVSSAATDTVSFIDTDPRSSSFHQVIAVTAVGDAPGGLAWQPQGEALVVCNRGDSSVSIVEPAAYTVQTTLRGAVARPLDVAVTARQTTFGFQTGTWFAYILNDNGTISIYESGPNPSAGPDAIVHVTRRLFLGATAIQPNLASFNTGCWVVHRDPLGLGAVSLLELTTSPTGPQPVPSTAAATNETPLASTRGRAWTVTRRLGGLTAPLSGNAPVDLAFDDCENLGSLPDLQAASVPIGRYSPHSGKGQIKTLGGGTLALAQRPKLLFVALADVGKIDVLDLTTGLRIRSIDAPGVTSLTNYWRQ